MQWNKYWFYSIPFEIKSTIVRLGEHDTTTEEDGKHIDVPIARAEKHEKYNVITRLNDIAVILLAQDVEFTGRLELNSFYSTYFFVEILNFYPKIVTFLFYRSHQSDLCAI